MERVTGEGRRLLVGQKAAGRQHGKPDQQDPLVEFTLHASERFTAFGTAIGEQWGTFRKKADFPTSIEPAGQSCPRDRRCDGLSVRCRLGVP